MSGLHIGHPYQFDDPDNATMKDRGFYDTNTYVSTWKNKSKQQVRKIK